MIEKRRPGGSSKVERLSDKQEVIGSSPIHGSFTLI